MITIWSKWLPHGHHMVTTWSPHGHHKVTKWSPHGNHKVTKWSPQGHHMVTLSPQAYRMVKWSPFGQNDYHRSPHGHYIVTTRSPNGHHRVTAWSHWHLKVTTWSNDNMFSSLKGKMKNVTNINHNYWLKGRYLLLFSMKFKEYNSLLLRNQ